MQYLATPQKSLTYVGALILAITWFVLPCYSDISYIKWLSLQSEYLYILGGLLIFSGLTRFKIEIIGKSKEVDFIDIASVKPKKIIENGMETSSFQIVELKLCISTNIYFLGKKIFSCLMKKFEICFYKDFHEKFFELWVRSDHEEDKIRKSHHKTNLNYSFEDPTKETYVDINITTLKYPRKDKSNIEFKTSLNSKSGGGWRIISFLLNLLFFYGSKKLEIIFKE